MSETAQDKVNRILRDHEGYTGDGKGGVGALPIGDRSTRAKPISKRDLREALIAPLQDTWDARDAAQQAQSDAEDARDLAQQAAGSVQYPVSYGVAQSLTGPQQQQARDNIGLGTAATKDHGTGPGEVPLNSDLDPLTGMVAMFAMTSAPSGWIKANGAAVSRAAYADLFAAIGTTFGVGDGVTTFNLPDLRGEFVRGWDDGRGADPGRVFGSAQGDAIRNITGKFDPGGRVGPKDSSSFGGAFSKVSSPVTASHGNYSTDGRSIDFDASRVVPTANENRPRNVALLACIKY